ncbi:tautomerase family protein [Denitromonas ohlonensis]|uniref:4-oxalocrotonate tautomerase n=2 Tax=Denitromonas TaxID=139331 RepID=A0A557RVG8_9RHOO|nr:4-oxalocrotonate tautomerase [Denitromonas ohlonensis]TVO69147.1 4-oxalocrotonate tautomerase [Denitromonas ohlonensis]TVO77247.1 4-oxalocrotonate tautomerase [Denitromonas ohlonensis]
MPYLHLRLAAAASDTLAEKASAVLLEHTTTLLGKKPEVTAIRVEFVDPRHWRIGGVALAHSGRGAFHLDIKITEGTNTKAQKASYVQRVFNDLAALLPDCAPTSYIVIDDVRADAWGFGGRTQEARFIQRQAL